LQFIQGGSRRPGYLGVSMIIEEMSMHEFYNGLQKTRTVLLPIGATEEHGPHLPLGTDTFQAVDVCRRLAMRRSIFVAPSIPYGVCRSTFDHPGTLSIKTETLKNLISDVVFALYRQGLRNMVVLSGHAGRTHNAALIDAGEYLIQRLEDLKMAVVTEYDLAKGSGAGLVETANDSHAGEIETSRMMATRPEWVKGVAAPEFPRFPSHILVRDKQRFWPGGVWGDPQKATAAKGRKIETLVVDALDQLVQELEDFSEN
jgi:creatinine amidohydrolase